MLHEGTKSKLQQIVIYHIYMRACSECVYD